MLQTLKLLLPALIPSWRFFDVIAPSPRVEFRLLETEQGSAEDWQEFRPRPERLSVGSMLKRMVWNPRWNESLFLVSCSERLMKNPTEHSHQEILRRIKRELECNSTDVKATPYLQFRLVFLNQQGGELQKHVTFVSPAHPFSEGAES